MVAMLKVGRWSRGDGGDEGGKVKVVEVEIEAGLGDDGGGGG